MTLKIEENADPEYGNMQAYELERQIKRVLDQHLICIQRYDHSRILEVLPKSLGKGTIFRARSLWVLLILFRLGRTADIQALF